MEQEYKWHIPQETLAALAEFLHSCSGRISHDTLQMAAVYYDTPDELVYRSNAALRLRRENEKSVCCLKRTVKKEGALAVREEYETEAESLAEGLQKLPDAGAPRDFCLFLSAQTFIEKARTEFTRNCYLLSFAGDAPFTAEFAVDVGALGGNGNMQPFEELELELKSGDTAAFEAFALQLERDYALIPQKASKLARAIAAAKEKA